MSDEALADGMCLYVKSISKWKVKPFMENLERTEPRVYRLVIKKLGRWLEQIDNQDSDSTRA